uniref:Trafficking protein particle complex subunit 6A isoform X7 n=1 Tax=Tursiops truncatus TaxID=9739 RepID=A0A6J3QDV1_TURTR|nr:trafficking protein particle complex subunit 6A isoform X7 [Tursiops truncatus]
MGLLKLNKGVCTGHPHSVCSSPSSSLCSFSICFQRASPGVPGPVLVTTGRPGISDAPSLGQPPSSAQLSPGHTDQKHTQGQKMSLSVLEGMGFRVGQALGERLPRETLAFREELDALKFLCKDVWAAVFQKQMDSLRTNHQGTYVLQDHSFPLLIRMASGLQYLEEAPKFLAFTCGLLRGTLSTLGIKSLVTASVAALPSSCFPWGMPAWRRQPLTMSWSSGFEHSSRCENPVTHTAMGCRPGGQEASPP